MWLIILASALTAASTEVRVTTIDGVTLLGSLVEMSTEGLSIETDDGRKSLRVADLLGLSPKRPAAAGRKPGVWIDLVDGSSVLGQDYTVADGRAQLVQSNGSLEIPTREIVAVRLQPDSEAVAAQWARIIEGGLDSDLLVVRKGDSLNYHRGVLGNVTGDAIQFELDGEVLSVKRSKVFGLLYYHAAGRRLPEPVFWLDDATGSRWAVLAIKLTDGLLEWTTPTGLTVTRPVDAIARIDFSAGKIVYLSDLSPESVQWTPYFGSKSEPDCRARFFAPRYDRTFSGQSLELGHKQYEKGLAIHSRTELTYRLPGRFRRFKAIVGIDDRVRPRGNARLVIRGGDRVLLETDVTGSEEPRVLDLDLAGVHRLVILVDFGGQLDVADHLNLCEARLVK